MGLMEWADNVINIGWTLMKLGGVLVGLIFVMMLMSITMRAFYDAMFKRRS